MTNILHLLKIEWLKLNKYKAFIILVCLFAISIFGINFIVCSFNTSTGNPNEPDIASMIIGTPFQFPSVWNTVSYLSSFLLFIPGLIMILIVSNEFSFRTHRQNIIDGVSRSQFMNTKIALILIISLCLTALVFIMALLFGLAEGGSFTLNHSRYLLYFFVQSTLYMSVGLVFALIFKRSGISIGIYFLYSFILENVLSAVLNRYFRPVGYLLPLDSADKLIPMPISLFKGLSPNIPDEKYLLLASFIWIALCLWFCKRRFENSDL